VSTDTIVWLHTCDHAVNCIVNWINPWSQTDRSKHT